MSGDVNALKAAATQYLSADNRDLLLPDPTATPSPANQDDLIAAENNLAGAEDAVRKELALPPNSVLTQQAFSANISMILSGDIKEVWSDTPMQCGPSNGEWLASGANQIFNVHIVGYHGPDTYPIDTYPQGSVGIDAATVSVTDTVLNPTPNGLTPADYASALAQGLVPCRQQRGNGNYRPERPPRKDLGQRGD
jgi:hypothetical protein